MWQPFIGTDSKREMQRICLIMRCVLQQQPYKWGMLKSIFFPIKKQSLCCPNHSGGLLLRFLVLWVLICGVTSFSDAEEANAPLATGGVLAGLIPEETPCYLALYPNHPGGGLTALTQILARPEFVDTVEPLRRAVQGMEGILALNAGVTPSAIFGKMSGRLEIAFLSQEKDAPLRVAIFAELGPSMEIVLQAQPRIEALLRKYGTLERIERSGKTLTAVTFQGLRVEYVLADGLLMAGVGAGVMEAVFHDMEHPSSRSLAASPVFVALCAARQRNAEASHPMACVYVRVRDTLPGWLLKDRVPQGVLPLLPEAAMLTSEPCGQGYRDTLSWYRLDGRVDADTMLPPVVPIMSAVPSISTMSTASVTPMTPVESEKPATTSIVSELTSGAAVMIDMESKRTGLDETDGAERDDKFLNTQNALTHAWPLITMIPADADDAVLVRVKPEQVWNRVLALALPVARSGTPRDQEEMETALLALDAFERETHIRMAAFLSCLGPDMALTSGPSGTFLFADLRDRDMFDAALAKLDAWMGGMRIRRMTYLGTEIRYWNRSGLPLPLAPCYAVVDEKTLLVAMWPHVLKGYLFKRAKGMKSLDHDADCMTVWEQVGGESLFRYARLSNRFERAYGAGVAWAQMLSSAPMIPSDPGRLPPASAWREATFGLGVGARFAGPVSTLEWYSPCGAAAEGLVVADMLCAAGDGPLGMLMDWRAAGILSSYASRMQGGQGAGAVEQKKRTGQTPDVRESLISPISPEGVPARTSSHASERIPEKTSEVSSEQASKHPSGMEGRP